MKIIKQASLLDLVLFGFSRKLQKAKGEEEGSCAGALLEDELQM